MISINGSWQPPDQLREDEMYQLITNSQVGGRDPIVNDIVEDRYFNRARGVGFRRVLRIVEVVGKKEEWEKGEKGSICRVQEMSWVRLVRKKE